MARGIIGNRPNISIHALLAESDPHCSAIASAMPISIHALLAESDNKAFFFVDVSVGFLSTLSLRRATKPQVSAESEGGISIHALLAESDRLFAN